MTQSVTMIRSMLRLAVPRSVRQWLRDRWLVRWGTTQFVNTLVLRPRLKHQLSWTGTPPVNRPSHARVLIPLLQTSHYQYYQILALAKALTLRGAAVRVLICDSILDGCEIKNSKRQLQDPCLACRHNARDLVGLFGLDTVRLSELITVDQGRELHDRASALALDYPRIYDYKGIEIIGMTNASITRHYYGEVPAEGSLALRTVRHRYLYSAMVGVDVAEELHRAWGPTALVNDMAVYADWEPYAQYFGQRHIPYNLVTMAAFDVNAIMLNYQDFYMSTERFDRWCETRESKDLDQTEQRALNALIAARFKDGGGFEQRLGWFTEEGVGFKPEIDSNKRNVFLFPNQAWDVGINYEGALYNDMVEWVLDSVRVLAEHPTTHLYVKTHPEESYGSVESSWGIEDEIRSRFGAIPSNVTMIPPQLKIRPYDLFPHIDLGVVYNSTIGLEMLLKGVPVVAAGAAPYGGHGLSFEPDTREQYADALLGRTSPHRPDLHRVELFAYFYFIKSQIPWKLTKQVYFDNFRGFAFDRLDDLLPGKDVYLDHLCSAILEPETTVVEAWE